MTIESPLKLGNSIESSTTTSSGISGRATFIDSHRASATVDGDLLTGARSYLDIDIAGRSTIEPEILVIRGWVADHKGVSIARSDGYSGCLSDD